MTKAKQIVKKPKSIKTSRTLFRKFEELSKSKKFNWMLDGANIRARDKDGNCFCPLTALYHLVFPDREILSPTYYDSAAEDLNIAGNLAEVVVYAADNEIDDKEILNIRRKLGTMLLPKKYHKVFLEELEEDEKLLNNCY